MERFCVDFQHLTITSDTQSYDDALESLHYVESYPKNVYFCQFVRYRQKENGRNYERQLDEEKQLKISLSTHFVPRFLVYLEFKFSTC